MSVQAFTLVVLVITWVGLGFTIRAVVQTRKLGEELVRTNRELRRVNISLMENNRELIAKISSLVN